MAINILDLKVKGLLDCGASCSILGMDSHLIFAEMGIPILTHNTPVKLRVANGHELCCTQYMSLPILYNGNVQIVNFNIQPDITTYLLLGLNFWKAFRLAPEIINTLSTYENIASLSPVPIKSGLNDVDSLNDEQKVQLNNIQLLFNQINTDKVGLGKTHLLEHIINTGDYPPIKQKYYRLSPNKQAALEKEVDRMLEAGIVEPSHSPWNSPVVMVEKPNGDLRLCLDSRKVNSVSKSDAYPLPYVNYILDNLRDAKYLTSLDLSAAYHQIPLSKDSKEKTAFTVPGKGLFHYNRMCFGLVGASATMQRLMDNLFTAEFDNKVFCYIDDIIICTSDFDEHLRLLKAVFDKLKNANLTINMKKSLFCRSELKYLGYVVDRYGLRTDPSKVDVILNFPIPQDAKGIKRFLGMAGWYRRFIRNFSQIARPLARLTSKRVQFSWSEEANESFNLLKSALVSAPILKCPNFNEPFYIHTDASSFAIGAVLTQRISDWDHPIAYCSRTLNKPETNYSATERELLAVIYALEQYRAYVDGRKCFIVTDHASLKWFTNLKNPTGRLNRWACRLSQFNFELIHRKGREHIIPDCLSRIQIDSIDVTSIQDPWYLDLFSKVSATPTLFPNFKIENNKLFRLSKNKYRLTAQFDWKLVVPYEDRKEILIKCHDDATAGHFGVAKTHLKIANLYFWPTLFQDVKDYVDACEICKTYKPVNVARPGLMGNPRRISVPGEAISCDILGPFPSSYLRNQYLFVCVDYFSKYVTLFPLRNVTAPAIVKCMEKGIFLIHGVPKYVYVDNGPQFISKLFRDLMLKYNVPHIFYNPRYHPQTNQTERVNRELVRTIASYVRSDHRNWDKNISEIQCALNNVVHDGTKFTPYFLTHGREMIVDGSFYNDEKPVDRNDLTVDNNFTFSDNLTELNTIFQQVRRSLLASHARNAKYYNFRKRHVQLKEGQIVYKRCFPLSNAAKHFSAKLSPRYEKCIIHKTLGPLVYSLKSLDGKLLGEFHIKDIVRPGEMPPQS